MQSEPVVLVLVFRERRAVGRAGAAARIVEEEERICRAARRRGIGDGRIFTVGSSSTF